MTWASIDSPDARSRRDSSRSTSLRAASGSGSAASFSRSASVVVPLVVLAELLLDRLELLAQVELPLAPAELLLDLRLDVLLGVEHRELALEQEQHPPQPLLDGERLEERLPVGDRDVEVGGDDVGELAGVADLGDEALDRLAREAGLGCPAPRPARAARGPAPGTSAPARRAEASPPRRAPSPRGSSRAPRCAARSRGARRGARAASRTVRAAPGRSSRSSRSCGGSRGSPSRRPRAGPRRTPPGREPRARPRWPRGCPAGRPRSEPSRRGTAPPDEEESREGKGFGHLAAPWAARLIHRPRAGGRPPRLIDTK